MSEFYPMPSFVTLAAGDLSRSLAWYEALGFQTVFVMPGAEAKPALAHLRWAKYADLMLRDAAAQAAQAKGLGVTLTFTVASAAVRDLDALAERARAAGAAFLREPGDRPWNARDFSLADPDGYALTFTFGPRNRDLDIGQVVDQVRRS